MSKANDAGADFEPGVEASGTNGTRASKRQVRRQGYEVAEGSAMRESHRKYIEAAIELAKTSHMESMHGCVIVNERQRNNPIIATGINQHIKNQEDRGVFSRHAEMSALANLIAIKGHNARFFEECTAYIARVGPASLGHPIRMSRPCEKCTKLLRKVGIERIVYTLNNDTICTISRL